LTDRVGLAEDARLGNAAVVVSCDANALARAIRDLLANPERQRKLGDAARQFVEDYLSLDAVGKQLEKAYRRATASGSKHSTPNA
jgi:glycosyltransferase involved in cell wall biosynthesis